MPALRIVNGQVLLPREGLVDTDLTLAEGGIAAIGGLDSGGMMIDARGLLVLPGIVDIHGDAFERQIQPRPGVAFPVDLALRDTETQLLANGITTAFHGITLSWEPGLRSLGSWRALMDALPARDWICDMRVHLRWEAFNLDALDQALVDIEAGRVHLLAFNDHTPAIIRRINDPVAVAKYSDRAGMTLDAFRTLTEQVAGRAAEVPAALDRLARAARDAGIALASHDDDALSVREAFRARGAHICEFPIAAEVGEAARAAGDFVVMGCPNVVRGGSHLGWSSAATLAESGVCNVLASDYFYPAMARAAMILAGRGVLALPAAWDLISANPAAATGLDDRGMIATGKRGDIVLLDPDGPRVVATIARGRIAHLTADGAGRLSG
jgi:alpha-D-ribose 1-methylphosphonate 5-triphosphate diphosphatase